MLLCLCEYQLRAYDWLLSSIVCLGVFAVLHVWLVFGVCCVACLRVVARSQWCLRCCMRVVARLLPCLVSALFRKWLWVVVDRHCLSV